jgi:ubiquinone/menaquinone biosynthesis C-methylase UbiE
VSLYDQTWGRAFAAVYDRFLAGTEAAGLRAIRAGLLSRVTGRTLEVGAGTGLNLDHYGDGVTELVLTEPFEPMARQLRARLAGSDRRATVTEAPAEGLPFADDEFDSAVCTLVLCTVDDQQLALAELRRVLRPGGRLYFCEHVRSADASLARWQDRLHRPWRWFGHGCNCNRDTRAGVDAAGFEIADLTEGELPKSPPIVRPLITGTAVVPAP